MRIPVIAFILSISCSGLQGAEVPRISPGNLVKKVPERVYLNVNSSSNGQRIELKKDAENKPTGGTFIIQFKQATAKSGPEVWKSRFNAFVAPKSGVYQVSASMVISGGNGNGDGVIIGFSVNEQGPWPQIKGAGDLSTTNVLVIEPGRFKNSTPVSLTGLLKLKKGDSVQVALSGVDDSVFSLSYSSFTVIGL